MKVSQLQEKLKLEYLSQGDDKEITGGFCGDLLSWVMANAQENHVWFTVMGNINAVAVASLNDVACVVLCQGSGINDDALAKAKQEKINILCTKSSTFDTATEYYQVAKG